MGGGGGVGGAVGRNNCNARRTSPHPYGLEFRARQEYSYFFQFVYSSCLYMFIYNAD